VSQSAFTSNTGAYGGAIENWSGASLTANSGTSYDGNVASGGGAINNNGTLTASGVSFTGNTAVYGGGIATDGTAPVSGCTFTTTHSTGSDFPSGGGAVANHGSLTVGGNSFFSGNTAGHDGGAVDNFGTATVGQTTFTSAGTTPGNSATNGGGAITN